MKILQLAVILLSLVTLILSAQVMVNARAVKVLTAEMRGLKNAVATMTDLTLKVTPDGEMTWENNDQ